VIDKFQFIISRLVKTHSEQKGLFLLDASFPIEVKITDKPAGSLLNAFMIGLSGNSNPLYSKANELMIHFQNITEWSQISKFLCEGFSLINRELESVINTDDEFRKNLDTVYNWSMNQNGFPRSYQTAQKLWSIFFPEGINIDSNKEQRIYELKKKRTVRISQLNDQPIVDPAKEILFTGNVLLTLPPGLKHITDIPLSKKLRNKIQKTKDDKQLYWYDHPIQIGIDKERNEAIYGLRGLQETIHYERGRGNAQDGQKITCVLSVSVTHPSLHKIARDYLKEEFSKTTIGEDVDIYIITESDTQRIINEIFEPAVKVYLSQNSTSELFQIIGVDGEYGRHYNFLKAILAFWNIFVNSNFRATFKIDLDQVFPQSELVRDSGASAFEHFKTPLWGAKGINFWGETIDLGMLAGALVNQRDIHKSLFTPDVPFPSRELKPDEYIFFSILPQALSTAAEMMTRYDHDDLDGKRNCLQRIHITGGTTGILLEHLLRFRPFTPSFIGRAEDQAYLLSTLTNPVIKLGYVHKDGLIMRHDKEGFAQNAIQSAYTGKVIGDYVRILYFSKYGEIIQKNYDRLKAYIDPFTGSFVSNIPITIVYLSLVLKTLSLLKDNNSEQAIELLKNGAMRIPKAIKYINQIESTFKEEKRGWNLYYDVLEILKTKLEQNDDKAKAFQKTAQEIIKNCKVN